MKNSTITSMTNFATAKMLTVVLVGILVFGALTSLPFGDSKIAEGRMNIENHDTKKNMGSSIKGNLDTGKNGGISFMVVTNQVQEEEYPYTVVPKAEMVLMVEREG